MKKISVGVVIAWMVMFLGSGSALARNGGRQGGGYGPGSCWN